MVVFRFDCHLGDDAERSNAGTNVCAVDTRPARWFLCCILCDSEFRRSPPTTTTAFDFARELAVALPYSAQSFLYD
jgi:hypothetical protein